MRFMDDFLALDSIVRFDPLLETGEASPVLVSTWLAMSGRYVMQGSP